MTFGTSTSLPVLLYSGAVLAFFLSIVWRPVIGLYYLVPLIPLQTVRYRLHEFPLGPSVIGILLMGVALGLLIRGQRPFSKTPWSVLIWAYVLFTFVSLCQGSLYLRRPLPLTLADVRLTEWKDYIQMPLMLLITSAAVRERRQVQVVVFLMCLTVLLMERSVWKTVSGRDFSTYTHDLRSEGAIGFAGPNGLAAFEAQFGCLLLALGGMEKKRLVRTGYYALTAFTAVCLMYTLSRGGYIAFIVGWLFLGLFQQRKLLLALAVFGASWTALVPNAVQTRVESTYDESSGSVDHSSELRLELWGDAASIIRSNPLLGTGFYTYAHTDHPHGYEDTHNIYVKVLVETGLVGLVLFLWLLGKTFHTGFRLFRQGKDPLFASLGLGLAVWTLCAGVVNLFGDRWMYLQVQGYFWLLGGLVASASRLEQSARTPTPIEVKPTSKDDLPAFATEQSIAQV